RTRFWALPKAPGVIVNRYRGAPRLALVLGAADDHVADRVTPIGLRDLIAPGEVEDVVRTDCQRGAAALARQVIHQHAWLERPATVVGARHADLREGLVLAHAVLRDVLPVGQPGRVDRAVRRGEDILVGASLHDIRISKDVNRRSERDAVII